MDIGYDRPLYVLPFDHRGTFQKNMFGWSGTPTDEQTAKIAAMKRAIYDGFQEALAEGVPQAKAGILVDEQFGADILRDAAPRLRHGLPGREEWARRVRLRVRGGLRPPHQSLPADLLQGPCALQPRGRWGDEPASVGAAQAALRLPALRGPSKFMFELLVPATPAQLAVRRR